MSRVHGGEHINQTAFKIRTYSVPGLRPNLTFSVSLLYIVSYYISFVSRNEAHLFCVNPVEN
jgi:hypothetical protein